MRTNCNLAIKTRKSLEDSYHRRHRRHRLLPIRTIAVIHFDHSHWGSAWAGFRCLIPAGLSQFLLLPFSGTRQMRLVFAYPLLRHEPNHSFRF